MLYLTLTNSLGCLLRCERYEGDLELKELMLELLPYLETGDTINLTTDADEYYDDRQLATDYAT